MAFAKSSSRTLYWLEVYIKPPNATILSLVSVTTSLVVIIVNVKSFLLAVVAGLVVLSGCGRGLETKEAVRQAVIDHLANKSGLNVSSMDVEIASVSFRKNEADTTVLFRPKGSQGSQGMSINYTLEKKGNRWVVKGRAEAGGSPHSGMAGGMPGAGAGMPTGHPPVAGQAPPGTKK